MEAVTNKKFFYRHVSCEQKSLYFLNFTHGHVFLESAYKNMYIPVDIVHLNPFL